MAISDVLGDFAQQARQDLDNVYNSAHSKGYAEGKIDGITEGYDQGVGDGYENGKAEGIVEGKKAEYDAFWDVYQNYGNRGSYQRAFDGYGFSFDNFYPKYDMRPTNCNGMFFAWGEVFPNSTGSLIDRLNELGRVLDTSNCTVFTDAFSYTKFTEIPTIDFSALTSNNSNVFRGSSRLTKIEKIVVTPKTSYANWFTGALYLAEIRVEGTIANDINFKDCKALSAESVDDIVTHLQHLGSGDAPEWGSRTLYLNEDTWARYEAYLWEKYPDSFGDYDGAQGYVQDNKGWLTA